jgi:hypothetical protein
LFISGSRPAGRPSLEANWSIAASTSSVCVLSKEIGDQRREWNCIPESTMVSTVLSLLPLLPGVRCAVVARRGGESARIVGVVISVISALSSGVLLKLLEFVFETHDG